MASDEDPFPSSLPSFVGSSPMMETKIHESEGDGQVDFFESTVGIDWHLDSFLNQEFHDLADASYQLHTSAEPNSSQSPMSTLQGLSFSQSPESSPLDYSSGSSIHQRNGSSNSSRSGFLAKDIVMLDNGQINTWGVEEEMSQVDPQKKHGTTDFSTTNELNTSNSTMAKVFDFENAASSPSPDIKSNALLNSPLQNLKMPYRSSSRNNISRAQNYVHRSAISVNLPEISPFSLVYGHPGALPYVPPPRAYPMGEVSVQPLGGHPQPSPWPHASGPASTQISSQVFSSLHHATVSMPSTSPIEIFSADQRPSQPPMLIVHPITEKSRVETQIPVKLTLCQMPPGVTKLHIATHNIARPKHIAKKAPERCPEMLELHVELVCTSAMRDLSKRSRALARAATLPEIERNEENRREASFKILPYADDDLEKPSNGGCVLICDGCMKRELKRADRKKLKNTEEEALWLPHSGKRIIMFNSPQVKDWENPLATKINIKKKDKAARPLDEEVIVKATESMEVTGGMQVFLPMRICCYCRHQEEKIGFQVIFTIKDYQDRCVAQAMTNSIMITDDHKTHVAPVSAALSMTSHTDSAQLPGAGVFSQEPAGQIAPTPFRHAYSATDLQRFPQKFHARLPPNPFAFSSPQDLSHANSTNLTPQSLSRPASPSVSVERQQKRRKGSGSGNLARDLTMTKINTTDAPRTSMIDQISHGASNGLLSTGASFTHPLYSTHQLPRENSQYTTPSQSHTRPATPAFPGNGLVEPRLSSQNLEIVDSLFSPPIATHTPTNMQSRMSSLISSGMSSPVTSGSPHQPRNVNSDVPEHQQQNALLFQREAVPIAIATTRPPTIHKIIPNEGSKSGGIEVTCLGTGFHQGLQVMFGDVYATTTTYWGESSLVCLLPPALHAGPVTVRFTQDYLQNTPTPSRQQIIFTYIDDDEPEIVKHALTTLVHKMTGRTEDPGEIVRKMRNGTLLGPELRNGNGVVNGNGVIGHAAVQHLQPPDMSSGTADPVELEAWLLRCLDLIDLDDSPFPPRLNTTRSNGQTMLHLSASLGFQRFAAALLARGAHPDMRDKNGMSPMHMASLNDHDKIVRKLRAAGGDPTLRSLRGYTPADMASTQAMCDIIEVLERSPWYQSARATPSSQQTRSSSVVSLRSLWGCRSACGSARFESVQHDEYDDAILSDDGAPSLLSNINSMPQLWSQSGGNSEAREESFLDGRSPSDPVGNDRLLAAATAWSAWRDQIATQVQQLQQSVHRTLPNLPMPTLPPMPNLPDYQGYPMMKKISSLVPQRYPRNAARGPKDNDYRWWDLLKGTAAPPAYNQLYPHDDQESLDIKKGTILRAVSDTLQDKKCSVELDNRIHRDASILDNIKIDNDILTSRQQNELRAAHAMKVKRLRSDRNLFFFWIPLLVLVMMAMLKDRVPQLWHNVCHAITYVHTHYHGY